jgi:hypothetical protein
MKWIPAWDLNCKVKSDAAIAKYATSEQRKTQGADFLGGI